MSESGQDPELDRLLHAALGGMTPQEALIAASRADAENAEEKAAAIARNRERALKLLAALEKSLG